VVLFNVAFWLVGFGTIATYAFYESVRDAFDAVAFGVDGIFGGGVALAKFAVVALDRLQRPDAGAAAFLATVPDADTLKAQAREFVVSAGVQLQRMQDILSVVRAAGTAVYAVLIVTFLALLAGLFLVFSASSRRRRNRSTSCTMCFMLFPLVLSWLAVAFVATAAVAAGDTCALLGDYHRLILDQAIKKATFAGGIDASENVIFANGVTCPAEFLGQDTLNALERFIVNRSTTGVTDSAFLTIFPGKDTRGVALYASTLFKGLRTCSSMVRFSGRLHQAVCQPTGPVLALFVIWFVLILLALVLTATFFVSQYSSFDATRFYTPFHTHSYKSSAGTDPPLSAELSASEDGEDEEDFGSGPATFDEVEAQRRRGGVRQPAANAGGAGAGNEYTTADFAPQQAWRR
jgi:hypothetical protein